MNSSNLTNRELLGDLYDAVAYHCGEQVIDTAARPRAYVAKLDIYIQALIEDFDITQDMAA